MRAHLSDAGMGSHRTAACLSCLRWIPRGASSLTGRITTDSSRRWTRRDACSIHPLLRKSAAVVGDVAVLGYLTYLEVWELDKFQQRMLSDPYTEEDEAAIARLGI